MTTEQRDGTDSRVISTAGLDMAAPTGILGFRDRGKEGGWALDFLTLKIDANEINGTYEVTPGQIATFTHKVSDLENIRIEIRADPFRRSNSNNYRCAGHP